LEHRGVLVNAEALAKEGCQRKEYLATSSPDIQYPIRRPEVLAYHIYIVPKHRALPSTDTRKIPALKPTGCPGDFL
jgi:hypothetical protein